MNPHSVRGAGGGGDKRERIMDAAMRVFASKGFFASKVSDIAEQAGVADGTIYLYFKSKDDLLICLFEAQMEHVNKELTRAMAGARNAPEKLRMFMATYMSLVAENRHAAEVITIELRQSAKFMKEYKNPRFAELLKTLAAVIEDGQKKGELKSDLPAPVVARGIFGALDELALMWVTGRGDRIDIRKVADGIGDLVLQGLQARPAAV